MRQRVKVATLFRHNGSSNMLLTITNTKPPATDLGYLLHKNPSRVQSFELSFGKAHVFYPEATENRCVAALLLDVDPVGLVRSRRGPAGEGGLLDQYVNDRPYVASSHHLLATPARDAISLSLSERQVAITRAPARWAS